MSVGPSVSAILDLESEFVQHLSMPESVEFFVKEGVAVDLINSPKIRSMWIFTRKYFTDAGKAPTLMILEAEFPDFDFSGTDTAVEYIVDRLKLRYQKNKVQDLTRTLADLSNDPEEAMSYLRGEFMEIERNTLSEKNIWKAGDSSRFLQELQEKILSGQYHGASFGFPEIDEFVTLRGGQLGILAARPKHHKTFLLLCAFIAQKLQGLKPALYTLELTDEEIMLRISCMLSKFSWNDAVKGNIGMGDYKRLQEAWDRFDALGDHFILSPPIGERTVPDMMLQADKLGADSILISQFEYIESTLPSSTYKQGWEVKAGIVLDLKGAAKRPDNKRPIYVEAQLNREKDLALTDALKKASDIIFDIDRTADMEAANQIELRVMDSRNTGYASWIISTELVKATEYKVYGY